MAVSGRTSGPGAGHPATVKCAQTYAVKQVTGLGHLAKLGAPDIRPSAGHPAYTNNISVRFLDIYGRTSGPGAGHPVILHKSDALWIAVAGHPGKSPDIRPTQKLQPPQK